jgi:hypothetical protein
MKERLVEIISAYDGDNDGDFADYLIANGVRFEKKVYFLEPIEDCKRCPKVLPNEDYCKEINLLYKGEHPKYSISQDWEFMCDNCPHEVVEREYKESDEDAIGKTVFLTKEEAEKKLKERKED